MSDEQAAGSLSRSTVAMASGTAVSRALGLVRAMVLVVVLGANTMAANAFAVANWLPSMLYMLIAGGVLNAVLVPQVVRAYRSADGQTYVDRLLTLSGVLLLGVTTLLTAGVPVILWIYGARGDTLALAVAFGFWCMPQVFFYGAYTLLGQVLNARGSFGPYMWAPALNNVVAIAGLVVFVVLFGRRGDGATDLAAWTGAEIAVLGGTATLGVVAQAAVLAVPLRRIGFRYRPRRDWRGAGLGTAGRVAGWTFAALVVGQAGVLAVQWVSLRAGHIAEQSSDLGIAGNNAYGLTFTIFMLPHSLVTVSLLTALFTRLSDHAAARDTLAVRADFSHGLRTIGVFTLFAAPGLAVLALPVARVIGPTARPEEVASLAPVIVAFMAGLAALGAWSLCQRVYYAYEDAKGLFRIQVYMAALVAVVAVTGFLALEPRWWVTCAAAGISASYVLGAAWGGANVWRRLGGGLSRIVRLHVRAGLASVVAAGAGWAVTRPFGDLSRAAWPVAVLVCLLAGGVMLTLYGLLLRRLGVTELDDVLRPLLGRLGRSMRSPGTAATVGAPTDGAPDGAPGADGAAGSGSVGPAGPAGPFPPGPQGAESPVGHERGGDRLDAVIGRGTLLAGRYRLHQPVGNDLPGADTWTARDQILDRPVRAVIIGEGDAGPVQDAARRAALVADPRLLRVLDVGDHDGVAYVVTEPVVGQDLAQLTANGPLPADQARAVVGEAAAALEVARRRGVHHLALRPSAVHVTPDGAVLVSGLAMDGELFEHGPGDAKATSRADTVGLVALLYLALTGRWPGVPGTVPVDGPAVAPSVSGAPVPPAELSPAVPNDLDTLCTVTLGPHDDGPHSPGELVRELEPWPAVDGAAIYDTLDAATRHVTVPSGPWDDEQGGPGLGAAAAGAGAAGAAGAAAGARRAGGPGADSGGSPGASPGTTSAASVQRQSIRQSVRPPGAPGASSRPGTPPSAGPPRPLAGPRTGPAGPAAAPSSGHPPAIPPAGGAAWPPAARPTPFDRILDEPLPITRRPVNATPIVLTIIGLLVVVGLVWAFQALFAPAPPIGGEQGLGLNEELGPDDEGEADGADGEGTETTDPPSGEAAPPAGPPVIASAQMIDPPPGGDDNEHPEAVDRAIDGDPGTFWYTRTYVSPTYGMKEGVGYAVTLQEPATVTTVRLLVNGTGGMVEVRATDPATPTEGPVLASGALGPETVLTLAEPTTTQHVVLWFTALPQTPDGSNRVELLEVQVS